MRYAIKARGHQAGHPRARCDRAGRLAWVLAALWVLNVLDLALTHNALATGVAGEANGLMAYLFGEGMLAASLFKLGVVSAGVVGLWLLRHHPMTLIAASAAAGVYACVVAYQLIALWRLTAL